jgi:hypothetical protein
MQGRKRHGNTYRVYFSKGFRLVACTMQPLSPTYPLSRQASVGKQKTDGRNASRDQHKLTPGADDGII